MTTSSFLGIAGARLDSLRQLSHQLRSLNWASVSLEEVEHELPDIEVAVTTYRRLTDGGAGPSVAGDPDGFLGIAAVRAEQLLAVSQDMQALEWETASLTEIENEIPELELTMSVYQRLTGEGGGDPVARDAHEAAPERSSGSPTRNDSKSTDVAPPSFSEFTRQSLEPRAAGVGETAEANGSR